MNIEQKNLRSSDFLLKVIVFLSICIIYAFSNIKELSIIIQLIFVGITIINVMFNRRFKLTVHFLWMAIFIIWGLFISLFSEYLMSSIVEVTNLGLKLLFYTSIIIFINNESRFIFVLRSLVVSGLILIIRVAYYTPINDWGTDRLGFALGLNPNSLGLSLSFAAIVSVYLGLKTERKGYYILTVLFSLIALLTGSKKVLLAIISGIFLLLYFRTSNKIKKIITLVFIIFAMFFIYILIMKVPFLYEVIGSRIEQAISISDDTEIDKSTLHRSMMINEAWELFKENPLTGIGLESFREYSVFNSYTHNNYMEISVSTGIIGFVIYYSLPVTLLISALYYQRNNNDYSLIIAIISVVLLLDIANVSYRQLITQVMLSISVGRFLMLKNRMIKSRDIRN